MINPTVGRVVLIFFAANVATPGYALPSAGEPVPGLIAKVWSDQCINVAAFDANGATMPIVLVRLLQEGEERPTTGCWAEWMPYQIKSDDALIAWLDSFYECDENGTVTNRKSPTAQRVIAAIRADSAPLPAGHPVQHLADAVGITFDQFVQFGRENGGNIVNGMPWSFNFKGHPVTHENDRCYLVSVNAGQLRFTPDDVLVIAPDGSLSTRLTPGIAG